MKSRLIILLISFLAIGSLSAQRVFRMGVRGTYRTLDVFELPNTVSNPNLNQTTNIIKQGDIGLLFRFNIGDHLYLQPELGVRPNTLWDSINPSGDLFQQWSHALSSSTSTSITVPFMVGWRLFSLGNALTMRVFVGPEFYTDISSTGMDNNWNTYSFCGGVGVDLIDLIYVDLRAAYNKRISFNQPPTYYTLTVGLVF